MPPTVQKPSANGAIATSSKRRFPADDVKELLSEELDILRAQLNQKSPKDIDVKIFVLATLREILPTNRRVAQDHLIRVLGEIEADYREFTSTED